MKFITVATANLVQLKAIAQQYSIEVLGDRRRIDTYRKAIYSHWMCFTQQVIPTGKLRMAATSAFSSASDLGQQALPQVVKLANEALDSTIAASLWTFDAGKRFYDWSENPCNKEQANQLAASAAAVGGQAFDAWCFAVATTIEAGYRSRPYAVEAFARFQEEYTATAAVLVQFVLGLRQWLAQLDWEEVEEFQAALPAGSRPVALLAPVREPAPKAIKVSKPRSRKAGSSTRKKGVGNRKSRAMAKAVVA